MRLQFSFLNVYTLANVVYTQYGGQQQNADGSQSQ